MTILLSVVIATKDRSQYLLGSLKSLLNLKRLEEIEIVVGDNTCDNSAYFGRLPISGSLSYFHNPASMTVSENFNFAVSKAVGEYILCLGDDDSVSTHIIDAIDFLKSNNVDAGNFKMARFFWPDVALNNNSYRAVVPYFSNKIRSLNSARMLKNSLASGFQEIRYLPRCYHAVIRKKILDEVADKYGSRFPGPSPDMANAVCCLGLVNRHVYIDTPYIISGYSKNSTAGQGLRGEHIGRLEDQPHLPSDILDIWPEGVLRVWTGETIWYVSGLLALQGDLKPFPREPNVHQMNFRLYLRYGNLWKLHDEVPPPLYDLLINAVSFFANKLFEKIRHLSFSRFHIFKTTEKLSLEDFQKDLDIVIEDKS